LALADKSVIGASRLGNGDDVKNDGLKISESIPLA
jgi:hypothetical protein